MMKVISSNMKRIPSPLSPQTLANFGLIVVVLVINGIAVHRNSIALKEMQNRVLDTHEVFTQAESLFASLVDAESGVRGFALTGDDTMLQSYRKVAESLPDRFQALRNGVEGNSNQTENTRDFEQQTALRMGHFQKVIAARTDRGIEGARLEAESAEGRRAMDKMRASIDLLKAEETRLLRLRTAEADLKLYTILVTNIVGVGLALSICGVAWLLINRQVRKCREVESKAIDERENLLVTLTSIGDAVIVTDAIGRVQLINPVAMKLMGYPVSLVGMPLRDVFTIINQSSRLPVKNPVNSVLESGAVIELSNHTLLVRPDGTEVPIEDSAAPIRDSTGKITGVVLVFRDCSSRWQFERELMRREQRFRKMFETPLLGIAVGTSDGRSLLEANDAYLDLIGYDRDGLSESSSGWGGVEAGHTPLDESAQAELKETGLCRPFEKVYIRNDGTTVPVLVSSTKLFDEDDRIIIFVTDLTGNKRSEAALRESEDRFRILSESMPQMVWTAVADGQFDYVNQTMVEYSGRAADELKGWGWTELLHPDECTNYLEIWKLIVTTGRPLDVEQRLRHRTGKYRWHLTRALPIYDAAERITHWIGTNTDIHDRKLAETLMAEEHQRKDQFLALLAHELRNPLAPLSNAIQILSVAPGDSGKSGELIAIMQRQVNQMTRLIDDLLDVARINQGRISLRRQRIQVATVVSAAVEAVAPWIEARSHRLAVTLPQEPLWIDGDAARLSQALTNLFQNAAKYTEPGGQIAISVESDNGEAVFRVRDNGPGLTEVMLSRIFELFMQVEQTLNRAHGGLGIGLTLVRVLVELHGGKVTAHSDGLGCGSEFVVRLPRVDAPTESVAVAVDAVDPKSYSGMRVLVVDDVEASAKTLALMVKSIGPVVETAFDGLSAIAKATTGDFDVIFLDIAMPGMDGLEVAKRLRSNPDLKRVRLVALTGFGQDEDRHRSLSNGFDEHLVKPTSLVLLKKVLHRK